MEKLSFPEGFFWGSATAAHQIEGSNVNSNWWRWENSEKRIAALKKQNKNIDDYISGAACDSYNRYREDFDIAKNLNQNLHRFSIEWARVMPEPGVFSPQEIEHYRSVLQALKERGIQSMVTLHHFTNPVWFEDMGGWQKKDNLSYFLQYAEKIFDELGDLINFVCVINEPNVYAGGSFLTGVWPPQKHNPFSAWKVIQNMSHAHKETYRLAKSKGLSAPVGTAISVQAVGKAPFPKLQKYLRYGFILKELAPFSDFMGIQYYSGVGLDKTLPKSDFGWPIYPAGLYETIMEAAKFGKPIFITENGIADAADAKRKKYIAEHLKELHRAIQDGAKVKGYLHWSLLDNFEWAEGYTKKFGLVEIDRQNNLNRKIRKSAEYYSAICKNNFIEIE